MFDTLDDAAASSTRRGIEALLRPRSVAIVGATPRTEALGGRPIVNLRTQGYPGRIYPVNPRHEEILGLACHPDLRSLPEAPDLVLVIVGQDRIFETLDDALAVGAGSALVFGAGFAEVSGEGVERQNRLKDYARRGLRICGPNCNGLFSVVNRTALGFTPSLEFPARLGRIALIAQSGNVSTCLSSRGMELGVGFSHFVATGNEADLEVTDFVEYLLDDDATDVFALFVEGFKDPGRFLAVAGAALARGKPIVLMKMGRTAASARVAASHTGALTGTYRTVVGALRQKGVVVVESLESLLTTASLFASGGRPRGGTGVAVGSLSGGMAGVIADACEEARLPLARFSRETEDALAEALPGVANLANPLDMTGQVVNEPDCWGRCLRALADDPAVDAIVPILSITAGQIERRFAAECVALARTSKVAQVCVWSSGAPPNSGLEVLVDGGVVVTSSVDDAVDAIAAWRRWWGTRDDRLAAIAAAARSSAVAPADPAGAIDGWTLLADAGIRVARQAIVGDLEALDAAASRLAFPVAVKIESEAIAHKTEIGGVRLGVRDPVELRSVAAELLAIAGRVSSGHPPARLLVQQMVAGRRELIVGLASEPGIGLAAVLGMGGIFAEALQDVAVRALPLTRFDAAEMLGELRARAVLGRFRGLAAVDEEALVSLLSAVSEIGMRHRGRIVELDVNPVIVSDEDGSLTAVDVLVRTTG